MKAIVKCNWKQLGCMGEQDPPSLEELGDDEPLPNYWAEETTITVRRVTKARLDEHRDGRPWDVYLEQLRRERADPMTLSDAEDIADRVSESLDGDVDSGEVALATADYLMTEYDLPRRVAEELQR